MKIFVTGASGFVGQHLIEAIVEAGHFVQCPPRYEVDCLSGSAVERALREGNPDAVIHLAATVGGIGANNASPADFWYQNLKMGLNVIDACRAAEIKHLVLAGTTCSYPKFAKTPFVEEALFTGYPEETNAPYGIAKLALIEGARAYRRQYGMASTVLVPTNMYGPGDNFDPGSSHVIPAIIRKMHEAKERGDDHVTLWGDGTATRDFLYVKDAAKAFVAAVDRGPSGFDVMNLGSGVEVSIGDLAGLIREAVGFAGDVRWDTSKPNGQPRRCMDSSAARKNLGWSSTTPFLEGLRETYSWFKAAEKPLNWNV